MLDAIETVTYYLLLAGFFIIQISLTNRLWAVLFFAG